jgi:DNA invertase Pin-like site-specific DNA recombinase
MLGIYSTELHGHLQELSVAKNKYAKAVDLLVMSCPQFLASINLSTGDIIFRSLGDAGADTNTAQGRLMLTVLGGLTEFEKDLIRTRTSEGGDRATARDVKLGCKPKLTEHQKREAIRRRDQSGKPMREIARSHNVSRSAISRLTA